MASVAAWAAAELLAPPLALPWTPQMRRAAESMARATDVVGRRRAGGTEGAPPPTSPSAPTLDPRADPNRTGFIGPEFGDLFTTLGQLEAKRTTTNPDVAALLVHLLDRAGVRAGDRVGIGASGSFPALLAATLIAVETLGARPVAVLSLGASSWGLTDPAFDLLHLYRLLVDSGVVATPPAAVSPGGTADTGADLDPEARERLAGRLRSSGVPALVPGTLEEAVESRLLLYRQGGGGVRIAAFVNIGGADANVGTSPSLLALSPGLLDPVAVPRVPPGHRGVMHALSAEGVPVIHLLDMRALASRHGLPWDPVPLPAPASTRLTRGGPDPGGRLLAVAGAWAAVMVLLTGAAVRFPRLKRDPTLP